MSMDSYRWFSKVYWAEKGLVVDCLVDTNDHNGENYIVLVEQGELKLHPSTQLKEFIPTHSFQLIGKAIKWTYSF